MPDRPTNLRRDYRLHQQIGAAIALVLTLAAFSVPTPPEAPDVFIVEDPVDPFEIMEIPPSRFTPPPPPPPAPPPPIEVENDKEVEDEIVTTMDIDFGETIVPAGPPAPPLPPPPPVPPSKSTPAPPPPVDLHEDEVFDFVAEENQPVLIGGLEGLQSRVTYPEMARRSAVEGTVYVQFIVDETGAVVDPKVARSPSGLLSQAALEAVRASQFEPGTQRGRAVKVRYTLPIQFRLR